MEEQRSCYIGTTVTKTEKDTIKIKAKDKQMKMSDYIRYCLLVEDKGEGLPSIQRLYSFTDAARILNSSRNTIYALVHKGILPCIDIGKQKKIKKEDLDNYIKSRHTKEIKEKENKYWTTKEVSKCLNVTRQTVLIYIKKGYLPAKKIGKSWLCKQEDVLNLKGTQNALKSEETFQDKDT